MLDSHEYLTKQGWKGKGTALRSGGIAKPLNVTQKRTLAGLGKDRDEAFPFWEHVYNASIGAIKIKVDDSDTDSDDEGLKTDPDATLKRTSTGIISNRRPTTGVVVSNDVTPGSRLDILGNAKRALAQRQLYSRFYRGPVITDSELDSQPSSGTCTPPIASSPNPSLTPPLPTTSTSPLVLPVANEPSKKRKRDLKDREASEPSERAARRAARRARREQKLQRRAARQARRAARAAPADAGLDLDDPSTKPNTIRGLLVGRADVNEQDSPLKETPPFPLDDKGSMQERSTRPVTG